MVKSGLKGLIHRNDIHNKVVRTVLSAAGAPCLPSQPYDHYSPFTAGPGIYSFFFSLFYYHIMYQLLNMLKIKRDTNQQDSKIVDLYFVKSE